MSWAHVRFIGAVLFLTIVAHYAARLAWQWMQ